MITNCMRMKVYLLSLIVHRCIMLLNVNTHANRIIERLFALMKFMGLLMNIYLSNSFKC